MDKMNAAVVVVLVAAIAILACLNYNEISNSAAVNGEAPVLNSTTN